MTKVISISVSDEHKEILDLLNLSPSGLFKQRMEQIRQDSENLSKNILEMQGKIKHFENFVAMSEERKKFWEEYQKNNGLI